MISDNLAPLFDKGAPGVRFRQGTVLTWDAETGANTIDLAGGTLTNVPILNTGEAIALRAGHVVGLLGQGSAWFIVGRITMPGDPGFASASVAFAGNFASSTSFPITTTRTPKATVTLNAPAWADEAVVYATASASLGNPNATASLVDCYAVIDGAVGVAGRVGMAPVGAANFQDAGSLMSHCQQVFNPGATITCTADLQLVGGATWGTSTQFVGISAIAIYRSTT